MSADILEQIVAAKRVEVAQTKLRLTPRQLHLAVEALLPQPVPSMSHALESTRGGIIAEFKRKSPSKGWIHRDAEAATVTLAYQNAGAAAVSILTDEQFFGGSDSFVSQARQAGLTLPVLYKNFIVDEYQLFQARLCGASAVLLIASVLSKEEYRRLLRLSHELGLEALLEIHTRREVDYADEEPDMLGVNNRCLGTFHTDLRHSVELLSLLPADILRVSESGISSPQDVNRLRQAGYRGFLIGETFMRQPDPGKALRQFLSQL